MEENRQVMASNRSGSRNPRIRPTRNRARGTLCRARASISPGSRRSPWSRTRAGDRRGARPCRTPRRAACGRSEDRSGVPGRAPPGPPSRTPSLHRYDRRRERSRWRWTTALERTAPPRQSRRRLSRGSYEDRGRYDGSSLKARSRSCRPTDPRGSRRAPPPTLRAISSDGGAPRDLDRRRLE